MLFVFRVCQNARCFAWLCRVFGINGVNFRLSVTINLRSFFKRALGDHHATRFAHVIVHRLLRRRVECSEQPFKIHLLAGYWVGELLNFNYSITNDLLRAKWHKPRLKLLGKTRIMAAQKAQHEVKVL